MTVRIFRQKNPLNCGCGDLLEHWEKFSGVYAVMCSVLGCVRTATMGAYVREVGSSDDTVYVIPICEVCLETKDHDVALWTAIRPVPADACRKESHQGH